MLRTIEPSLAAVTGGPTLANPTFAAGTLYRIQVTSKTTNVFAITKASPSGAVTRTCTRPNQKGGCGSGLRW